jgi:RimJ/RimL family protein N-acetyltransferase
MTQIGPTLETARLILRPPSMADFERYAQFIADEETARFIGGVQPHALAWRSLAVLAGAWTLNGYSMFSWIEKESGLWVGRGGPWKPEGWPGEEIAWGTAKDAQGKGYAKEAAAATADWAFDHLGWSEMIHCIDPANAPSIATAKSLGSVLLRTDVQVPPPLNAMWDIYGQTREQWRARRASLTS